jgi:hypothetical protein
VGTTLTTGTAFSADWRIGANGSAGAFRMGMYLDITKGSPNYTLKLWGALGIPGTAQDLSASSFLTSMTAATPTLFGVTSAIGSSNQTIAVDEGANGTLNAINCWWNQSVVTPILSDIAIAVLS